MGSTAVGTSAQEDQPGGVGDAGPPHSHDPQPFDLPADPLAALADISREVNAPPIAEDPIQRFQRLETVHRLAGTLTHDFNNMLGVMVGVMESLAQDLAPGSEQQRLAEFGLEAAERGSELLGRILALSRHRPPPANAIDCSAMVDDTLRFAHHAVPKIVQITASAPATPLQCMADKAGLEAALLNLCINAGDAMTGGGMLNVDIRGMTLAGDAAARLGLRPGAYVGFIVSDTGHGMSSEILAQAMEPLFTTKQATGGTGLGLSSVSDFARGAGGGLKIDSREGVGTTATLYIPRIVSGQETSNA